MKTNYLAKNLIYLRKQLGVSQYQLGLQVGKGDTTVSSWEKGQSRPSIDDLMIISNFFAVPESDLLNTDLANVQDAAKNAERKNSKSVQDDVQDDVQDEALLPDIMLSSGVSGPGIHTGMPAVVTVDTSGRDNVVYVPVKARAGYLSGYADAEFISSLPAYSVPGLNHGTFRAFEVDGNSMFNTLHDHDTVIGRWATDVDFRDDRVFVIVTKTDGILVKRCIFRDGKIIAKSDNNHRGDYPTIVLELSEVAEVWYVVQRWTRQMSQPGEIYKRVIELEAKFVLLEARLNGT